MGITTRLNTTIRDYWPDDDEYHLYIPEDDIPLPDLISRAYAYFGDRFDANKIHISFENIHVRAIDYDLYDPVDWQNFIIICLEEDDE